MKAIMLGVLVAVLMLSGQAMAKPLRPVAAASFNRPELILSEGWRFSFEPTSSGPENPEFDDSAWATVEVPHTWNRVGYYIPDPDSHLNKPENINKSMGTGWYRLGFHIPTNFVGKRTYLQFDAASRIAEVWVNGIRLGEHNGGFSRFRFDATQALRSNQKNVLVVKVDNTKPAPGSSTADVLPLAGDFFVHGGLYRPVSLIATSDVHIDMLDFGGSGIYASTTAVENGKAQLRVIAKLRNDGMKSTSITAVTKLIGNAGRVAASDTESLVVPAQSDATLVRNLQVNKPHFWNGVKDPYLYRLVVELSDTQGNILDGNTIAFGIRQMRFDPANGFFLNGVHYPLRGVGYHQDREGKGWAISPKDVESDLKLLRDMGANTIRLTHYQHGQTVHDLADRYGLILWDEVPLVSQWTLGGAREASPGLVANARQQLAELIRQNQNHPSVVTWGIANEVDFGNSLPAFLTGSSGTPPDPVPLLRELNALSHELDPSRPTALATCCEGRLFAPGVDVPITANMADLGGANRYFGWYYGNPSELSPSLDALRAKRPEQPLAITEYGAGGAVTIHTDNPEAGQPDSRGRKQPEEVESKVHEQTWAAIRDRADLWASWLWVGFDFASTVRQEGDAVDINTKGLITYDRATKKDAYFFYKANWTKTPTVHITGRRYVQRAYAYTDIRVYSNAPQTKLSINGKRIHQQPTCTNMVCVWRGVKLNPGTNVVKAQGKFGRQTIGDQVVWRVNSDVARNVRIDAGAMVAGGSSAGTFGSDNFFFGGDVGSLDKPADYGKPAKATHIQGAQDRDIAATYRRGQFAYRLPLANGNYLVRLSFVSPCNADVDNVFDVAANGETRIAALTLKKTAEDSCSFEQREFDVAIANGQLELAFVPTQGEATVSAIELLRRD